MAEDFIQTPPELKDHYRYIKLLGEGANGKTYLAIQLATGLQVTIKSLKFAQANDLKSLELFKREAQVLSSINIKGVPVFYESIFSENNDNTYFIVQEYIEYPSLQDLINQNGKLNESQTLDIIQEIATILFSLQTLYTPPIIHRDIKPSNILLNIDDSNHISAYLIDFGAVANPQKRAGGSTIAGTFGYMAPEQLLGDVCLQSDFYALGATALYMLTGVPPYKLESDGFNLDFITTLEKYAPDTSQAMQSLLKALLAPEIDKRPHNAQKLLKYIDMVREGKVITVKTLEDMKQNDPNLIRKFNSKLYKLQKFFFSTRVTPNKAEGLWQKLPATIRCIRSLYRNVVNDDKTYSTTYDNCYEYTYTFDQTEYVGIVFCSELEETDIPLPAKCTIQCNTENPRMSRFMHLKDKEINKQSEHSVRQTNES